MASRTTSRSITLRVGQDEKIRKWYREKFFQISGYFQDCIEILEKRPELLDTVRPGLELSRALDRADDANAMAEHLSGIVDMITDDGITFVANFNTEFRGRIKDAREYLIARGAPRER